VRRSGGRASADVRCRRDPDAIPISQGDTSLGLWRPKSVRHPTVVEDTSLLVETTSLRVLLCVLEACSENVEKRPRRRRGTRRPACSGRPVRQKASGFRARRPTRISIDYFYGGLGFPDRIGVGVNSVCATAWIPRGYAGPALAVCARLYRRQKPQIFYRTRIPLYCKYMFV